MTIFYVEIAPEEMEEWPEMEEWGQLVRNLLLHFVVMIVALGCDDLVEKVSTKREFRERQFLRQQLFGLME